MRHLREKNTKECIYCGSVYIIDAKPEKQLKKSLLKMKPLFVIGITVLIVMSLLGYYVFIKPDGKSLDSYFVDSGKSVTVGIDTIHGFA